MKRCLARDLDTEYLAALATAFVGACSIILCLYLFFPPQWETNDDVDMSMVAHGYGLTELGSPNIIFSNVLWGLIVRLIPTIFDTVGYSVATVLVLITVSATIIFVLLRWGYHPIVSISLMIVLTLRAILFPQFTLNAGLLTLSTVIMWSYYIRYRSLLGLAVGCFYFFVGYIVRNLECFVVLFVALPLLPWRRFLRDRIAGYALIMLSVIVVSATVIDHWAYDRPAWDVYKVLSKALGPYTDFRAADELKGRPDIFTRYGYSQNDLNLVRDWFFVDPGIADPRALQAMVSELGLSAKVESAPSNIRAALEVLWQPTMLPFVSVALILGAMAPTWRLFASWIIYMAIIIILALLGRPAILRVYIPPMALLAIAPLLAQEITGVRRLLVSCIVFVLAIVTVVKVGSESREARSIADSLRKAMIDFPVNTVVVWGASLPYEYLYPVLGTTTSSRYHIYQLDAFTWAPFSLSFKDQAGGHGFLTRLVDKNGLLLVASGQFVEELRGYCREHLHGRLDILEARSYGWVPLVRVHCFVLA
jgi:hypothetical protein